MQDVATRTSMPSFLQPVPSSLLSVLDDPGLPIQANEWQNLSTIHLPLALISYCSFSGYLRDEVTQTRLQEIIDHTMDLVQAVRLAFKRSIDPPDISAYNKHIRNYLQGLEVAHPNATAMPYMHMALHIKEHLQLFGPVYSWRTHPHESLVGELGNMLSDAGTGEYTIHLGINIHSDTLL